MTPPESRILMTTDAVGGVWTYSSALATALCARGHEIVLVSMGPAPRPEQRDAIAGVRGLTLEVTDLALEWMDPEGHDLDRAYDVLAGIAERVRPDLVHLNSFREAVGDYAAPVLVAAHSCVGSWWQACRPEMTMDPRWKTYLRNVARGLDAADAWVAPTRAYRAWIENFYLPRQNGEAIWNGADVTAASAAKEPFILAAGRLWDEAKNIPALARVAPALAWPVRVAGPSRSPDGGAVEGMANVELLGDLPHSALIAEMGRAAIFVSPALYEPFGLTALEAANCGCALVLSDISSLRELWKDAALFVDPRDEDALTDALRTLCRDDALRLRLQRNAAKRARRYSLAATAEDYRLLYRRLTASVRAGTRREAHFAEARG